MAEQTPRTRSGGGFVLIIVGIVLALATAALVLFLTSGGGGGSQASATIIVSTRTLPIGAVLSTTNGTAPYIKIADAFRVERVPIAAVPADAFVSTNGADLNTALNGQVIVANFLAGDILRRSDTRMTTLGTNAIQSLVNHNPAALPPGDVLYVLHTDAAQGMQIGAQEGDHVDILATLCASSGKSGCQLAQTTLQNLAIYAVPDPKTLVVAVSHEDALVLKMLIETAKIDFVLRKPGDTAAAGTTPIDPAWLITHFGFTSPTG